MKSITKFLGLLSFVFLLSSCAKVAYISEQGAGQVALEWNGRDNEDVLDDPKVEEKVKIQIRNIQKYKKYFYQYFSKKDSGIYDETTFLEKDAVTYLLIASPYNKIEPIQHSFPIVGSFPYIGFFKEESAKEFEQKLIKEDNETYIRPVYAYSTLDQWIFNDNILSSFFHYDEHDLAELIFHELIHTIYFVKDEVDFNENLAMYLGRELAFEYFNYTEEKKTDWKHDRNKSKEMMNIITSHAQELDKLYTDKKVTTRDKAVQVRSNFLKDKMLPKLKSFCDENKVERCWPLKTKWNNAKFAAFMTYDKEQDLIGQIHKKHKLNLKELLKHFVNLYEQYDNNDLETKSFKEFIIKKENI